MATRLQAIAEYRPRLQLQKRVGTTDLAEFIALRTGVSEGTITQVLIELRDALLFFTKRAQPVHVEGLGTYTPGIDLDGAIHLGHRADKILTNRLNTAGAYQGEIINRETIGKTSAELVAQWNQTHPNDPIA